MACIIHELKRELLDGLAKISQCKLPPIENVRIEKQGAEGADKWTDQYILDAYVEYDEPGPLVCEAAGDYDPSENISRVDVCIWCFAGLPHNCLHAWLRANPPVLTLHENHS